MSDEDYNGFPYCCLELKQYSEDGTVSIEEGGIYIEPGVSVLYCPWCGKNLNEV